VYHRFVRDRSEDVWPTCAWSAWAWYRWPSENHDPHTALPGLPHSDSNPLGRSDQHSRSSLLSCSRIAPCVTKSAHNHPLTGKRIDHDAPVVVMHKRSLGIAFYVRVLRARIIGVNLQITVPIEQRQ
jgi:hypothetical protein